MPYYMVHIACYTELKLQICNYVQKERICRENSKYAPDENFCGHCGCQLLPPYIPIILMVSPTQVPLSCSNMSHSCFLQPSVSEEGKQTSDMWTNNFLCPNLLWHEIDITFRLDSPPPHFDKGSLCQWSWLRIGRDLCTGGTNWLNPLISNALARIIRQLCLKVNLYGVLVFNIAGLQNVLNTFQQECCRPGHFWGEDQSWRSPNKCHYVKVSFFASWCFLSQPSIAAVFYLPSHHPRASLATSAQGNCLQRSPPNGEKASTASTALSVLFSGLLMASPVPHQISSCSLSTSIIADFNWTIRWGDKTMSRHT